MLTSLKLHSCHLLFLLCVLVAPLLSAAFSHADPDPGLVKRQTPTTPPLVAFQVQNPVLLPTANGNQSACVHTRVLMDHEFAFSYGKPFVGEETQIVSFQGAFALTFAGKHVPPPCDFNRVVMNFTVNSKGHQFDRLGLMYLGDVEVFRTSTAEPTSNGIVWTYIKEMDHYKALWKTEQKIIFDLGNLIDSTYTASFNTILTATFFTAPQTNAVADQILPISARRSADNGPSAFSLPSDNASVAYWIPQNTERAVVSLLACGQGAEEFWYTNAKNSEVSTFASQVGELNGYGPLREVQLFIDGQITGAFVPPTVIFTGGIAPGLWRPIVGIDAFDLTEFEIDVTPWLPLLCNGASHTFEIRVVGYNDDGRGNASLSNGVGSSWIVTGKIFLFLGPEGSVTSGTAPEITASPPVISITSELTTNNFTGANESLRYHTGYERSISVTSTVRTSNGTTFPAFWYQRDSYVNTNLIYSQGFSQFTLQITNGIDISSSDFRNDYNYRLELNSNFSTSPPDTIKIYANITRDLLDTGHPNASIFPPPLRTFTPGRPYNRNVYLYARPGRPDIYPLVIPPSLREYPVDSHSSGQAGSAFYSNGPNGSRSTGEMAHRSGVSGWPTGEEFGDYGQMGMYYTGVSAVNSSLALLSESLLEAPVGPQRTVNQLGTVSELQQRPARKSARGILGRGPGEAKRSLVATGGEAGRKN
ncbi:MAG: hypothetical protein Q9204_005270 [Flavoplaca sp. TL-2023a]